jgi:hypothetical protein
MTFSCAMEAFSLGGSVLAVKAFVHAR